MERKLQKHNQEWINYTKPTGNIATHKNNIAKSNKAQIKLNTTRAQMMQLMMQAQCPDTWVWYWTVRKNYQIEKSGKVNIN